MQILDLIMKKEFLEDIYKDYLRTRAKKRANAATVTDQDMEFKTKIK